MYEDATLFNASKLEIVNDRWARRQEQLHGEGRAIHGKSAGDIRCMHNRPLLFIAKAQQENVWP